MKAEIKDENEYIQAGLRQAGFNVDQKNTELILNIIDYVKEKKGNTTIREIIELKELSESLFED